MNHISNCFIKTMFIIPDILSVGTVYLVYVLC